MDYINSKHLVFIICGTSIVSLKTCIHIIIRSSGRDSWIAAAIASAIIFIYLIFIISIMNKKNNFDFINIIKTCLGKFFGSLYLLLVFIFLILQLIECAATEANAMHTNLFVETPNWYLIIFFVFPAIYSAMKGLAPVVSISIIGVLFAMLAGINLVILTAPYKNYTELLPIIVDNNMLSIINSIILSLGMESGIFCTFIFFKYVHNKEKIKKYSIFGFAVVAQMLTYSAIGVIATYGPERALLLAYPKLTQTQEISYMNFIESGELFVMFQIIGGWFVKYVITFFVIRELLKTINLDNIFSVIFISVIVAIASYFASKELINFYNLLSVYYTMCSIVFILIPLLFFVMYSFKKN